MSKISILYASLHHQNTFKVVNNIKDRLNGEVVVHDLIKEKDVDIKDSDYVIFASGIWFYHFHKSIEDYIERNDIENKKIILLYTCGLQKKNYVKWAKEIIENKKGNVIGYTWCYGYNTHGFLEKVGGMYKKHPNNKDFNKITKDINKIIENS